MPTFRGCYTATVTPFGRDGGVDLATLDRLIDAQIAGGVQGIVPVGTTGESPTLTHEEHREVFRRTIERVAGRVEVCAGCGSNSTEEALSLTRHAAELGATSTLHVVPYYNKPTQEGLYRHFEAIARATRLPVMLYNIPGRTGTALTPATIARLAKLDTVRGLKEATGNLDWTSEVRSLAPDLDILSGDDSLTLPIIALGGTGVVSVASNIVPRDVSDLVAAALCGDLDRARSIHYRLYPLVKALFIETNPIPVKTALGLLGRAGDALRLPLCEMEVANKEKLRQALGRYGLP
jgi:4-hydroxy-tetrahydrodipicolinate synthase